MDEELITLTKSEVVSLLRSLSQVEGVLMSTKEHGHAELMDYPVGLIYKKLTGEDLF